MEKRHCICSGLWFPDSLTANCVPGSREVACKITQCWGGQTLSHTVGDWGGRWKSFVCSAHIWSHNPAWIQQCSLLLVTPELCSGQALAALLQVPGWVRSSSHLPFALSSASRKSMEEKTDVPLPQSSSAPRGGIAEAWTVKQPSGIWPAEMHSPHLGWFIYLSPRFTLFHISYLFLADLFPKCLLLLVLVLPFWLRYPYGCIILGIQTDFIMCIFSLWIFIASDGLLNAPPSFLSFCSFKNVYSAHLLHWFFVIYVGPLLTFSKKIKLFF